MANCVVEEWCEEVLHTYSMDLNAVAMCHVSGESVTMATEARVL